MDFLKKICGRLIKQLYIKIITTVRVYGRFLARVVLGRYRKSYTQRYPTTLQLPITYKCNFDCVMCGMQSMINKPGFTPCELQKILDNSLFRNIKAVGVNGGEPFLLKNLEAYIQVLFDQLPKLKDVYIISNGYFSKQILENSKSILALCHEHKAQLHLSISIDGYGEMQDLMRGKVDAFKHAAYTCKQLLQQKNDYCDSFGLICTITKINVYHLAELDIWAKQNQYPISYNIATVHRRINNDAKYKDFSVFMDDHARLMAAEFFYSKYLETKKELYYGLYYVVYTGCRIASCDHQTGVVTLTPDGALSYCATHSEEIGSTFHEKANKIFFKKENTNYRKRLQHEYCNSCTHYSGQLTWRNYLLHFAKARLREIVIYR